MLWDLLPTGKLAGGAPMNVAYHANALGLKADIISRIGEDELGTEIMDFLVKKGFSANFIQTDQALKTGIVAVQLDAQGSPTYDIVQPVAWDNIENTEGGYQAVAAADMLVYGSLVCRAEVSKATLFNYLKSAKKTVFDVNLRAPFYDKALIERLLQAANIVKMNEHELDIIASWFTTEKDFESQIRFIQQRFDLDTIIVSQGSIGAYCFEKDTLYFQKAFQITVKDTIGSGDAFLAGFLIEKIQNKNAQECLITACKAGAYVATQAGATPPMSCAILGNI